MMIASDSIKLQRMRDLLGQASSARLVIEIPEPDSPYIDSEITYYFDAGSDSSYECETIEKVAQESIKIGINRGKLRAFAHDPHERGQRKVLVATYDFDTGAWGEWE